MMSPEMYTMWKNVSSPEQGPLLDKENRAKPSFKGAMSLRADYKVSVAQIAKEWANGGGHPNAAGGRINGFKEQYRYDKVKQQILRLIDEKESRAGNLEYKKED